MREKLEGRRQCGLDSQSGQGMKPAVLTPPGIHQQRAPRGKAAPFSSGPVLQDSWGMERKLGGGCFLSRPFLVEGGADLFWRPFLEQGREEPCQDPGSPPEDPRSLAQHRVVCGRKATPLDAGVTLP